MLVAGCGEGGEGWVLREDALRPQSQAGVVTGNGGTPFLQMAIRDGHGIATDVLATASVGQRITLDVLMQDTSTLHHLSLPSPER